MYRSTLFLKSDTKVYFFQIIWAHYKQNFKVGQAVQVQTEPEVWS